MMKETQGTKGTRCSSLLSLMSLLSLALSCCHPTAKPDENARHYAARGIIRGIAPDRRSVDVEHEDIRGFMPSMTMPLPVRDSKDIVDLKLGDGIAFRLNVTDQDVWIDQIKKIPASDVHLPVARPEPSVSSKDSERLREGDRMPSFTLTSQGEQAITLATFQGAPFVLTFVFTRCPLPTFCPRMSENFEQIQTAIKNNPALARTRLLSITLDPQFDTPKVLRDYAAYRHADAGIWTFATGEPAQIDALTHAFSVYVQTEGGTISHGLATALITPDGKIDKVWRGNGWAPAEVIEAIRAVNK
jgi:protein SCO1/2